MKRLLFILALLASHATYSMDKGKKPVKEPMDSMVAMLASLAEDETNDTSTSSSSSAAVTPCVKCYFSPNIKAAFLNCIANEQTGMRGSFYKFTLYHAAQAIVKAINDRKIGAELVIDEDHFKKNDPRNPNFKGEFCSPLKLIVDNGGIVRKMNQNRFSRNLGQFETMHIHDF